MPRYSLAPPNDGVVYFHDLKFGRGDYEREQLEYSRAFARWWPNRDTEPKPLHWRVRVKDAWAGIYIYEHPEKVLSGYNRPLLYPTPLFVESLLESPEVLRAVQYAAEERASMASVRKLHFALSSFMSRTFRPKWEAWRQEELENRQANERKNQRPCEEDGVTWQKVFQVYEQSIGIIADWLLVNYETFTFDWSERILRHVPQEEISDTWLNYLQALERKHRPQVRRIKSFGTAPQVYVPQPEELSNGNSATQPKRSFRPTREFVEPSIPISPDTHPAG